MKKSAIIAVAVLFSFSALAQKKQKTVIVDNVEKFVEAISSNTKIKLKPGKYDVSSISKGNNYSEYLEAYDGEELSISNVTNFTIEGIGKNKVEIITKPQYGNVFVFNNSTNITIKNVIAGHGPEKGYCTGGVFKFTNSSNIFIENCVMYGSGIEGISGENVNFLDCKNSIIKECTYGIMSFSDSKSITFSNCEFFDNQEFDMVYLNTSNLNFDKCTFRNNKTVADSWGDYAIFRTVGSSVSLKNCTIKDNQTQYLGTDANSLDSQNTKYENNLFRKSKFKK